MSHYDAQRGQTPCKRMGLTVGDTCLTETMVSGNRKGTRVSLARDDGSAAPLFRFPDGTKWFIALVDVTPVKNLAPPSAPPPPVTPAPTPRPPTAPVNPSPRKAAEFLQQAQDLMAERGKQYDADDEQEERSMGKAVAAFNAITGQNLSEPEGWLLMQVLKDVRQWSAPSYHQDSAEDGVAYSALKAESLEALSHA